MDRIFQFRPGLCAVPAHGVGVFLVGELGAALVKGDLFMHLCPRIDGRRTVAQLVDALAGTLSEAEVLFGVDWLAGGGHLVAVSNAGPERQHPGVRAPHLRVDALGDLDPGPLVAALRQAGCTVDARGPMRLVVVHDHLDPALEAIHRESRERRTPWMPVKPGGLRAWIGPVFEPDRSPCWDCLATRLRGNRPVQAFLQRRGEWPAAGPAPAAADPAALALVGGLTATILARHAAGDAAAGDALWTLDPQAMAIESHPVSARPRCPACGSATPVRDDDGGTVTLRPGLRRVADDGGHRTTTPESTYGRLRRHVSPLTGVVSSIGPLPGRHPLRPVFAANYLVCPVDDTPSFDDFHRSALGKGKTVEQARASALCEALERWSAIAQGDEPTRRATYAEIRDEAVRPADLLNFSARQYRQRQALNLAAKDPRRFVPAPAADDLVIDWTPAWSLTHGRRVFLPTAYCYSHFRTAPDAAVCSFNPNGHAAGNGLEEAILQGFLELVERDSVALWWYSRAPRPGVDLDSFGDAYFTALQAHYASIGWQLWALDIGTDLGIPAFAALAKSREGGRFCIGFGCHLDAQIALQRALTEVNQLFELDPSRAVPWSADELERDDFLFPTPALGTRTRQDYPADLPDDLRDEILHCVARARAAGLETLVLNLTRPDVDLAVAKVVVPGLRHFWPRFGPGRLYDVPAALGWVPRRLSEDELNPAHLFL